MHWPICSHPPHVALGCVHQFREDDVLWPGTGVKQAGARVNVDILTSGHLHTCNYTVCGYICLQSLSNPSFFLFLLFFVGDKIYIYTTYGIAVTT